MPSLRGIKILESIDVVYWRWCPASIKLGKRQCRCPQSQEVSHKFGKRPAIENQPVDLFGDTLVWRIDGLRPCQELGRFEGKTANHLPHVCLSAKRMKSCEVVHAQDIRPETEHESCRSLEKVGALKIRIAYIAPRFGSGLESIPL